MSTILRSSLTQIQKYQSFKKAFDLINKLRSEGHYIASYVLLFSIIEDRINALYAVSQYISKNKQPPHENSNKAIHRIWITRKIATLADAGDIPEELRNEIRDEAIRRNRLVHEALWHHEDFTENDVKRLQKLVRAVDKARKDQKKKLGK